MSADLRCAVCGTPLGSIDEACPNCLPNFYTDPAYRVQRPKRDLRCPGVGRDKDNLLALQFYFNRRVTDDEMRFLHDVMRRAVACMPEKHNA